MLMNISIAIDREFYHCDDNEHISMNVLGVSVQWLYMLLWFIFYHCDYAMQGLVYSIT